MGIDLSLYRARIGCFSQRKRARSLPMSVLRFGRCLIAFAVLTVLLHIGGIEPNPGPDKIDMDEIRKMNSDIMSELRNIRGDLRSVSEKCDSLEMVCKKLEEKQAEMAAGMKKNEEELARMDKSITEQGNTVDKVCKKVELIQRSTEILAEDIDRLEAHSRRDNLRFFGIPEEEEETYESCASSMVNFLIENFPYKHWSGSDIIRAHRVGRQRGEHDSRPMIVKFARWSDTVTILKARDIRDNLRRDNLRIAADYTRRQAEQLKGLRQQGKIGAVRGGRVVEIEGRWKNQVQEASETDPAISGGSEGAAGGLLSSRTASLSTGRGLDRPQQQDKSPPGRGRLHDPQRRASTRSQGAARTARGGAGGGARGASRGARQD